MTAIREDRIIAGRGAPEMAFTADEMRAVVNQLLESWPRPLRRILVLPPDFTRFHSSAGELAMMFYEQLSPQSQVDVMPALGTHTPMEPEQIATMFPGIPANRFLVHNWREDIITLGEVPGAFVEQISEGKISYSIAAQINRRLVEGQYDLIVSIGQVVPHEVAGMANHNKNLLVGVGGADMVNKSHFLGAVHGMERMMGRADTPVRQVFDYAEENFLGDLPVAYLLTVKERDAQGRLQVRGLYAGQGKAPFTEAAALSQQVNLDLLDRPIKKALVWMDPSEYKSTWLGNKAIYRLRMAMEDDGDLIVLAPGIRMFGEDPDNDTLIRRYGYRGTPHTLELVERHEDLRNNLSAAAHLIHGSSEGRFRITYAAGGLTRDEVESAGFTYADPDAITRQFQPERLDCGWNTVNGEEIFYVDNPALGLWALRDHFKAI